MTREPAPSPAFFASLESLRGLASCAVALFHVGWLNALTQAAFVRNSYLMVDIFFVLSGFVVCHSYRQRISSLPDFSNFMWMRLGRLYPLHLVFLAVAVLIEVFRYVASAHGVTPEHPPFQANDWDAFLRNLFLVQGLSADRTLTFNGPSWSISTEMFAYLIFGAVLLSRWGQRHLLVAAVSLWIACSLMLLANGAVSLHYEDCNSNLARCAAGFFLGVATYECKRRGLRVLVGRGVDAVLFAGLVGFLALKTRNLSDFAVPLLAAALIFALTERPASLLNRALNAKVLRWLGRISYSVYMAHTAVLWVAHQTLRLLGDEGSVADGTLTLLLAFCGLLVVSEISFRAVEAPCRALAKSFARGYPARAPERQS